MSKEITYDDGTKETVFTAEDMAAKDTEIAEAKKDFNEERELVEAMDLAEATKIQKERDTLVKEKGELLAEKNKLEEGSKNKDENFGKFRTLLAEKDKKIDEVNKRLTDKE